MPATRSTDNRTNAFSCLHLPDLNNRRRTLPGTFSAANTRFQIYFRSDTFPDFYSVPGTYFSAAAACDTAFLLHKCFSPFFHFSGFCCHIQPHEIDGSRISDFFSSFRDDITLAKNCRIRDKHHRYGSYKSIC